MLLTSTVRAVRENFQPRSCCIDLAIARSIQQYFGWIFSRIALTLGHAVSYQYLWIAPSCKLLCVSPVVQNALICINYDRFTGSDSKFRFQVPVPVSLYRFFVVDRAWSYISSEFFNTLMSNRNKTNHVTVRRSYIITINCCQKSRT
jgi:hypothetical protein